MKYNNTNFLQLTRKLWRKEYKDLSVSAKWLFVTLNECEQRFANSQCGDRFFRTNEDLARDCGMSEATVKRAKKELEKAGLIKTWLTPFDANGKKSEKHVCCYRVLK